MAINENTELEELIRNATGASAPPETPALRAAPEDDDDVPSLDIATLVLVARRTLLWLLLLLALGVTASWLYLRYTKPVYKSSSLLKIDERAQANELGLAGQMGASIADKARAGKLAGLLCIKCWP